MTTDDIGKQRLRPFLEAQINSSKIEGLRWLNDQKTKFRIPWWHSGKPDWNPERGQLFKEWAIHTGRYRQGIDDEDWVSWKTRLRCALNKATPGIVECKSESRVRADESDPFKVYEFKPRQPGKKKVVTGTHAPVVADATAASVQGTPANAPVPTFLNNFKLASDDQIQERMPSDLNEVHKSDLMSATEIQVSQMSFTEADTATFDNLLDVMLSSGEASNDLEIVLYYSNNVVWDKRVNNPNGCRIYYGDGNLLSQLELFPVYLLEAIIGDKQAEVLWLPPVNDLMPSKTAPHVQRVLERGMERGVLLQCRNSNIVAYRLCKCSIFHASVGTNGDPRKLPLVLREKATETVEPTMIFDYENWFLPALNQYALHGGPLPDPRVFLLIGSEKKLSDIDENVPIYATVASCRALQDLKKVSSAMTQNRLPVQKYDVDDVANDVGQMSLESIDMMKSTDMTTEVPGYGFTPDPGLLPGNFIDPDAIQDLGCQGNFFNVNFALDQSDGVDNPLDPGSFPATIDADMWSQLSPRLDDPSTVDLTEFSDLIVFQ